MSQATADQVLSIVANIKNKSTSNTSDEVIKTKIDKEKQVASNNTNNVIKGKPKSGRFWKEQKQKFSSINKTKGLRLSFEKKTALRLELKRTKDLAKQAMEELKQKQLQKKEKRRENLKKAEEKRKKSEVVQVITNSAKIKRMRKKQLRFIEKRDTNKEVEAKK